MKQLSKKELETELDKLLTRGTNDIQLDKEDLETIINRNGLIYMSVADYSGKKAACKAMKLAIEDLKMSDYSNIRTTNKGVLVHFKLPSYYPALEMNEALELMYDEFPELLYNSGHEEAYSGFCTSTDNSVSENYACVTVFINEFEIQKHIPVNNI